MNEKWLINGINNFNDIFIEENIKVIVNKIKIVRRTKPALNRSVTASALKRLGFQKTPVGTSAFVVFFSTTLPAPANLAVCFIGGCQRLVTARTLANSLGCILFGFICKKNRC
jgi:hypothetical protein